MLEQQRSSVADDQLLEAELDKLFALQDKPLAPAKRGILVRELNGTGMPLKALISGLRSLINDDLTSLKFSTICAAARRYIETDSNDVNSCKECSTGLIVMEDDQGRQFSLACRCIEGAHRKRALFLEKWNGEEMQHSKDRQLYRVYKS